LRPVRPHRRLVEESRSIRWSAATAISRLSGRPDSGLRRRQRGEHLRVARARSSARPGPWRAQRLTSRSFRRARIRAGDARVIVHPVGATRARARKSRADGLVLRSGSAASEHEPCSARIPDPRGELKPRGPRQHHMSSRAANPERGEDGAQGRVGDEGSPEPPPGQGEAVTSGAPVGEPQ